MAPTYGGVSDECPYDLVSGSIAECPRFDPQVVFDRPDGPIFTCSHARCSIDYLAGDDGSDATFYLRCMLRTGEFEAEREFLVPLD
jgi:hypothetical protein